MTDKIKIEIPPDYIDTMIIALEEKAKWHASQEDESDLVIVAWINQIIKDLKTQSGQ